MLRQGKLCLQTTNSGILQTTIEKTQTRNQGNTTSTLQHGRKQKNF